MPQPTEFGRVFREVREAHNVSQNEVAQALGINPTLISNVERGHADSLSAQHFSKLRKALRLTPKELVRLRRARLMTMLDRLFESELMPQPIERMKAIIATSRPGKRVRL